MKLKKLEIEGYRGIGGLKLSFNSEMTVLLGRNGVGKSSILDAIASILAVVQNAWPSEDTPPPLYCPPIPSRERKSGCEDARIELLIELEGDTCLPGGAKDIRLETTYRDGVSGRLPETLQAFWNFIHQSGLQHEARPLMVYYRQDRGFEQNTHMVGSPAIREVLQSSLQGNLQAISHLQAWWDKRDAEEARRVRDQDRNYRDSQLEAIRTLIKEIDGFTGISYSSTRDPEGLYFEKEGASPVHVSMLSSGERSFIILLADLARRLQMLNPRSELSQIPGIVLIDEIELNLHPAWQSKIISTLKMVFSSCQFVITTHSPQVVSSVESDHVVTLTANANGQIEQAKPLRTKGQTSNYLLEGVFGSNERFPEIDNMIENFNAAIDARDLNEATALYARINDAIEGDPPELLVFRKRLSKLRGER